MPEGEERFEKKHLHFVMQSLLTAIAVREVAHRSIRRQSLPGSSRNQFEASRENVPRKRKSAATASRPFRRLLKASALTTSGW